MLRNSRMFLEKYDTVVFFDTETTGVELEPNVNCITELAVTAYRKISAPGEEIEDSEIKFDWFVEPYDHRPIPDATIKINGITDYEVYEGDSHICEADAAALFGYAMEGKTLLIAHNCQFDLNFVEQLLIRADNQEALKKFYDADYLDTLSVARDRRSYPHKLKNCIDYYHLGEIVHNTHRAIDDTEALVWVTDAMIAERNDLMEYINVFGYLQKYGVSGREFEKIYYMPQAYGEYIKKPKDILPRTFIRSKTEG